MDEKEFPSNSKRIILDTDISSGPLLQQFTDYALLKARERRNDLIDS